MSTCTRSATTRTSSPTSLPESFCRAFERDPAAGGHLPADEGGGEAAARAADPRNGLDGARGRLRHRRRHRGARSRHHTAGASGGQGRGARLRLDRFRNRLRLPRGGAGRALHGELPRSGRRPGPAARELLAEPRQALDHVAPVQRARRTDHHPDPLGPRGSAQRHGEDARGERRPDPRAQHAVALRQRDLRGSPDHCDDLVRGGPGIDARARGRRVDRGRAARARQLQPRDRDHARADLRLPPGQPLRLDVHPGQLPARRRGEHARRPRPRHAQPADPGEAGRAEARLCLNRRMERLRVDGESYGFHKLDAAAVRLPYTLRILLENVLRHSFEEEAEGVAGWVAEAEPSREISFHPARVLLQDFTGVPAVVDLAAMRDAMEKQGGDPKAINPLIPAELVIDHSVQVDEFASRLAIERNVELEFERNRERYAFLRWGQGAFDNFRVVPPNTGICHQVNLEYLARVVEVRDGVAFPDTLVGTDSHTTMVNGLGVLGWGVGGIEAEAAMLGEALSMLVPQVVGFRLSGALREGATATDLVLTVTQILRRIGVVGKFVEYFGPGVGSLSLADRATLGNMSPETGATCCFFPIDEVTVEYLRLTGRSAERVALVEAYCKENQLWHEPEEHPKYSQVVELDLDDVEPSLAGPRRPQDRVPLARAKEAFIEALGSFDVDLANGTYDKEVADSFPASDPPTGDGVSDGAEPAPTSTATLEKRRVAVEGEDYALEHGSVVIAAITSCTNTSNPSVMIAAGLLAQKAVARGLTSKPWVKASLAPGSKVVTDYLKEAGLDEPLDALRFNLVGYGCTTCIGNSGPLALEISKAIHEEDLVVAAVLSGNRNFEGRINSDIRANYLASPPLVVAYALAGTMDIDLLNDPIANDREGKPVYLKDIWPTQREVHDTVQSAVQS